MLPLSKDFRPYKKVATNGERTSVYVQLGRDKLEFTNAVQERPVGLRLCCL